MAKPKRAAKKNPRPLLRLLAPARQSLAKQSAAVLALGLGLAAGAPAEAAIVYTQLPDGGKTLDNNESWKFLTYSGDVQQFQISHYSYSGLSKELQSGKINNFNFYAYVARSGSWGNVKITPGRVSHCPIWI